MDIEYTCFLGLREQVSEILLLHFASFLALRVTPITIRVEMEIRVVFIQLPKGLLGGRIDSYMSDRFTSHTPCGEDYINYNEVN